MTENTRDAVIQKFLGECLDMLQRKGRAYAGSDDVLAFFKTQAAESGITPYQAISTMKVKHEAAIREAIKQNPGSPVEHTEGLRGRIMDAINFNLLLLCLLEEGKCG